MGNSNDKAQSAPGAGGSSGGSATPASAAGSSGGSEAGAVLVDSNETSVAGGPRGEKDSKFSVHRGVYSANVQWNGTRTLVIRDGLVSWKGVNVTFLTGDAAWSDDGGDHVLTCKVYVPWQTSVWANGTVGLNETLILRFAAQGNGNVVVGLFSKDKGGSSWNDCDVRSA